MTDEEMTDKYAEKVVKHKMAVHDIFNEIVTKKEIKEAVMYGLKAGRPEWHKVSEQIPTEEKEYLVKLTDGTVDVMTVALDGDLEPYLLTPKFDFYQDVEKWCEIPKE